MSSGGMKRARELTSEGFHYDNLMEMAGHCRGEVHPEKLVSAFVLNRVFTQLADELGDGPVMSNELQKLEAKYRTAVNLALETAMAGAPKEEQDKRLVHLIQLLWALPETV
jgi:hypothetical protein